MEGSAAPRKSRSKLMVVFYVIVGFILLTMALEALGLDVVGTREHDTMIDRPHDNR